MELRSIRNEDFSGKKICLRVDFNIELTDIGKVEEHFRIDIVKETVAYLKTFSGAKIALLAHYGRPEGKREEKYSLSKLLPFVENTLQSSIVFVDDCKGEKVTEALETLPEGSLLLLENTRFYPEEESNDPQFSEALAKPFDCYVNEAFSACHRDHASITGIARLLPSFAGYRLEKEVKELDKVRLNPEHPAIAVIGGAKIETKLPLIRAFEPTYDCILVGGKIANEALDQKIEFSEKVLLPTDFDSSSRFDIGPNTIAYYTQILKTAKTVVWNGPMGKFEEKPYDMGTESILNAILDTDAHVVIGGGESLAVVEKAGVMNKVDFVSSGGGAMLEYLSGKILPGLEILKA